MSKEFFVEMAGFTIELLLGVLDRIEPEAEKAGMTPKEYFAENDGDGILESVQELSEDLNNLPEDVPGRMELFEKYEEVIEKIEKYRS